MKLSVSNIAWPSEKDDYVFTQMAKRKYSGLEIAPTKCFPSNPYQHLSEANRWANEIFNRYGLRISSMQSIWYGRPENIFHSQEERILLLEYTKKAIDFAQAVGCHNIVFGCPKNRNMPASSQIDDAIDFFKEIGNYAFDHSTIIALEANPPIYQTNFINSTREAIDFINLVDSNGFLLNLDIGTMIDNRESVSVIENHKQLINHVHISEPKLVTIKRRTLHIELAEMLKRSDYSGYVSIEVANQTKLEDLFFTMDYAVDLFS